MSTRSPMNQRNQNHEGVGMTRKSAGSAKPARAAAASVRVVPASSKEKRRQLERGEDLSNLTREEKKARKQEIRRQEDRIYSVANIMMRRDEEYMKYRKVFWFIMVFGMAFIGIGWISLLAFGSNPGREFQMLQLGAVGLSYVCIIGGFIFDMVKIRPIRNKHRSVAEGMSDSKITAMIEEEAAADARKREEREARKLARKKK